MKNDLVTPLIILGVGYFGYKYFGSISKQNRYYAGLRVQLLDAKMHGDSATIVVNIQNPNSEPATIRSIVGDLMVNGVKVGNVSAFKTIIIKGNAQTNLGFNVKIKILNTITEAMTALAKGNASIVARLKGTVNVNNDTIPFDLQHKLI